MTGVGRPLAFGSAEEMERAIDLYFETDAYIIHGKDDNGDDIRTYAPTMAGLAMSLGVDRKTLTNYSHKDEYFPAIKKARAKVEIALEQHLYTKNVTGAIFNLKNNFGWTDKTETDITSGGEKLSNTWNLVGVKPDASN